MKPRLAIHRRNSVISTISSVISFAMTASAFVGLAGTSQGATFTWDGFLAPGNPNWTAGGATNWIPVGIPVANDDLQFGAAPFSVVNNNDIAAGTNFNSITFLGPVGSAYSLDGNAISLGAGGITNNSSATNIINFGGTGVTLSAGQTWDAASGALNVTSAVDLNGNTLIIAGANNTTLAGAVTGGAGGLTMSGSGTLIMSNAGNSYTGATLVNSGTLQLDGTITGSILTVGSGGTLTGVGSSTAGVNLSGTGIINLGAGATLASAQFMTANGGSWNGLGTVDANLFVNSLNLSIGSGANLTTTGTLSVNNAATISAMDATSTITGSVNYNSTSNSSFQGVIAGATSTLTVNIAGATILGTGQLALSGNNTYGGATQVTSGTLQINSNNALSGSGVTVSSGASLNLFMGANVGAISLIISGDGVSVSGGPAGAMFGSSSGGTVGYAGAITLAADARIGMSGGNGFNLTGGINNAGYQLTLGAPSQFANRDINVNSVISGAGALVVDHQIGNLNASNTYGGSTTIINGGIINATVAGALPAPVGDGGTGTVRSALSMDQSGTGFSTLNLGAAQAVAALTGATTSSINLNANTLTIGTAAGSTDFAGVISGAGGSLIKDGASTQILSGANTYDGTTTVSAGILQVNSNDALGTIAAGTSVTSGAALVLNGVTYSTAEALSINGAGILNGGALVNVGTSSYAGQVTAATSAVINAGGGTLTFSGGLVKDGVTLALTGGGIINIDTVGISGASPGSDLIVDSVTVNANVANTYNGPTFIRSTGLAGSGILNANAADALPTLNGRTAVTMDDMLSLGSSQLNLIGGFNQSIASLTSGVATSSVNLNANTLTIGTAAGTTTFAGVISGVGGSLIKDDLSTQVLSGVNTYTGTTAINGGTLQLDGSTDALSEVQVGTAGTLTGSGTVNGNATLTGNGVINFGATGNIVGTLTVTGGNWNGLGTVASNVNVTSGNLSIGSGANLTVTHPINNVYVNVSGAATFSAVDATSTITGNVNYTSTATSTFQGVIAGPASTFTLDTGTTTSADYVYLTGNNTYGGLTTVTSGRLIIGSNTGLGGTGAGTSVASGATLSIDGGINIGAEALSIAGSGVTASGVGIGALQFGTFGGGVSGYAGLITLTANATIGSSNPAVTANISGGIDTAGNTLTLGTNAFSSPAIFNIDAPITGAGDIVVDGHTTNLNASNTYTGSTSIINGGVLNATVAGALPAPVGDGGTGTVRSALSMDQSGSGSSTLNLVGFSQAVASLTGAASSSINLNANTLTVGTTGGSTDFAGVISGTGGNLLKDGTSVQVLSNNNTYTGTTRINDGTLRMGIADALPTGTALTINPATGATRGLLDLNGFDTTIASLTIVAPQTSGNVVSGAGILTVNGDIAVVDNTTSPGNAFRATIAAGTLDLGGATRTFNVASQIWSGGFGGSSGSDLHVTSIIQNGGVILAGTASTANSVPATVEFTGANTYVGGTQINANSVLLISNNSGLGTGSATVQTGGTLTLNNGVSIANALNLNGSGANAGAFYIHSGALEVLQGGAATVTGLITAASNASISTNGNGSVLNLNGGIDKTGVVLTLTNVNGGTGTININTVGISGASANSDLIVDSVTVNENVANTYNGPTFIRSTLGAGTGILNANVLNALPTANGRSAVTMDDMLSLGGSQLNLGANQTIASLTSGVATSSVNLNANTLTIGTGAGSTNFAGVISGTGGNLLKDGTSEQILSGVNTYTGTTRIDVGTLRMGITNALPTGTALTINPATGVTRGLLDLNGFDTTIASLTIVAPQSSGNVVSGAGVLTVNGNIALVDNTTVVGNSGQATIAAGALDLGGATRTFNVASQSWSGGLTGFSNTDLHVTSVIQNGGVVIAGTASTSNSNPATVEFTGANTYADGTQINANSVLLISNNSGLGTGAATVQTGGTLTLNNGVSIANALFLNGSGANAGTTWVHSGALEVLYGGTATVTGLITAASNATISTNGTGSVLNLNGGIDKTGVVLTLTNLNGATGTININTVGISGASANSDLIVDSVTVNENVANTYNGPTFIRSTLGAGTGILNANVIDALPTLNGRTVLTMDDSGLGSSQLNLGADQTIASLIGAGSSLVNLNSNTLTIGTGAGSTNFAGVISGLGNLIKDDGSTQELSGVNTYTGTTSVNGGTLLLTGSLDSPTVGIALGATLVDQNGGLATASAVTNAGTLTVNTNDTIGSFTNNNGTLDGPAILTVNGVTVFNDGLLSGNLTGLGGVTLNNGTTVSGNLLGTTGTNGNVLISGTSGGGNLTVNNGSILTLTGTANNLNVAIASGGTLQNINGGLNAGASVNNMGTLTMNGPDTITLLTNTGLLQVTAPVFNGSDLGFFATNINLGVGSQMLLSNSTLTVGQIADIFDGSISGVFTNGITATGSTLRYAMNYVTGQIQALPGLMPPVKSGNTIYDLTENQTWTVGALFEDTNTSVPVNTNFRKVYFDTYGPLAVQVPGPTNYFVWDMDPGTGIDPNPTLAQMVGAMTAIQSTYSLNNNGTPLDPTDDFVVVGAAGKNIINQLSPEVHRGMVDYTEQALRSHVRDGVDAAPISKIGKTQVFATLQTSTQGAEDAIHNASYDLDMTSLTTGVRYDIDNRLQIGGMLGVDDGSIEGSLIDTEAQGIMVGIFGRYLVDEASKTKVTASLAYGSFDYDATRRSYGGSVTANGISSDAIEFALGVSTVSFEKDGFRVIPNASIRFMTGSVDSFVESGPGVNLAVGQQDLDSMLLDLGVDFEYQAQENLLFVGHIGYVTDFEDSDNTVAARFAAAGALASPFTVQAPGIDDEAFVLGLGAYYDINASARVGLTYRGEFRMNSESSQSIGIGASFGF